MDSQKIDMFFAGNAKKFPSEKIALLHSQLEKVDDSKLMVIQSLPYKDPTTMIIISFFLGGLGVDRFMLGQTGLGVAKLLTCGGIGVWALVDLFTVAGRTRELNYNNLTKAL